MMKEIAAALFAFSFLIAAVSSAAPEARVRVGMVPDSVCPCSTLTQDELSVSVKNLGDKEATYALSMSLPDGELWSGFIVPQVTLAAGEEASVPVFLTPSCRVKPGKYAVEVSVSSGASGKVASDDAEIEVGKCRWVEIKADDLELCQGKKSAFMIKLENQGTGAETVRLSTGVEWAKLPEGGIKVGSGETAEAELVLTPPKDLEAAGEITISAVSDNSYMANEKVIEADIRKCYGTEVSLAPKSLEVCPCKSADFNLTIRNTGLFGDNYTVAYGDATQTIGVKSGEEKVMKVWAGIPCDGGAGEYPLAVSVTSADPYSPLESSGTVSVSPFGECYSVALLADGNASSAVGVGESETYRIVIGNKGRFTQTYEITADGPSWVHLSESMAELEPGYGAELYMYAAPEYDVRAGKYTVNVSASSAESGEQETLPFEITVVSDFGAGNASMEVTGGIPTGQAVSEAGGAWPKMAMITVLAAGVVFILVLRFAVLMK